MLLSVTVTWLTFQSSISFVTVIFLIMPKARRSSYTMAFRIKVVAKAEAVENSSEIAWDYWLSEFMVRRLRRDQATILSVKLKMPARGAKMSRFTPKCPERDEQAMERFSRQREQYFFVMWKEKSFCRVEWDCLLMHGKQRIWLVVRNTLFLKHVT